MQGVELWLLISFLTLKIQFEHFDLHLTCEGQPGTFFFTRAICLFICNAGCWFHFQARNKHFFPKKYFWPRKWNQHIGLPVFWYVFNMNKCARLTCMQHARMLCAQSLLWSNLSQEIKYVTKMFNNYACISHVSL